MKKIRTLVAICILSVSILNLNSAFASEFSDVDVDSKYYDAISEISDLGIVKGYDDGSFKLNNNVTKVEMAVMISRMNQYDFFDRSQYPQLFKDIPYDYWAFSAISKAAYCGCFSTYNSTKYNDEFLGNTTVTTVNIENNIFQPDRYVTYAEAVKAVITILGYNGIAEKMADSREDTYLPLKFLAF